MVEPELELKDRVPEKRELVFMEITEIVDKALYVKALTILERTGNPREALEKAKTWLSWRLQDYIRSLIESVESGENEGDK